MTNIQEYRVKNAYHLAQRAEDAAERQINNLIEIIEKLPTGSEAEDVATIAMCKIHDIQREIAKVKSAIAEIQ